MAFSTARNVTSGGRVLMCGAFLEPVRSVFFVAAVYLLDQHVRDILFPFNYSGVLQAALPEVSGGI